MVLGEFMLLETDIFKTEAFKCSYLDEISLSGLFLRSKIHSLQKSIANNYVTIKKIFSYTIVQPKVTNSEYNLLKENGFMPLEYTSDKKMYEELMTIIDWSNSEDLELKTLSDEIFKIRVRELKYILANVSSLRLLELEAGHWVLDRYLEFIAG